MTRYLTNPGNGMTLLHVLKAWADDRANAPALLSPGGECFDRGALVRRLENEIAWMQSSGFGRRHRLAVIAPPGVTTAIALLATASGAVCVPVNPAATEAECLSLMRDARVDALRASDGHDFAARRAAGRLAIPILQPGENVTRPIFPAESLATPEDIALLMVTSGTTSRPKMVPLTHRQILARAIKTASLLGLREDDRCLNLMPLCYMHGLNSGLFGPLLSGSASICPNGFNRDDFVCALKTLGATWYTAGATHQRAIMSWLKDTPAIAHGLSLRFARSGSSPLPESVRVFIEAALKVPLVESYSSTETGTMTANPPFGKRKAGSVGCGSAEELAILGEDGQPLPAGMTGEVAVRGDCVFAGYEADGTIDRGAFRSGWFCTGDIGQIDQEGYLTLSGRIKDIINRGGEKVSPAEVDAVLLRHEAIVDAATFAVAHPSLHEDVVAAVVMQPGLSVSETTLRDHVSRHLAAYKIPRRIIAVASIPKTPTGKLARATLAAVFAEKLAETGPDQQETPLPMLDTLLGLWKIVLNRTDIGPNDNFFQAGGDSLSAVALLLHIEKTLQASLAVDDLARYPTASELALAMIRQEVGAFREVMPVHAEGVRTPLFAVCGRFGYALRLIPLAHQLDGDQPFYALQPPAMDWETVGCTEVAAMAAYYVQRLREIQPNGPYRLLGTSFGGLIVYQMAIELQRQGARVDRLILVDSASPSHTLDGRVLKLLPKPLAKNEQDQPTGTAAAGVRVAWQHYQARGRYCVTERFKGMFHYFYCLGEPIAPARDKRRLWRRFATNGVRYIGVAGLHGCFHTEPQFSDFCRNLRACLSDTPPPGNTAGEVFLPRWRLTGKANELSLHDARGKAVPVLDKAQGHIDAVRIARGQLIVRGWVVDTVDPASPPHVLVLLNGRHIGSCDCAYALMESVAAREGGDWPYPGFVFRHPPFGKKHPAQSKLQVFDLSADKTRAWHLGNFLVRKDALSSKKPGRRPIAPA